MPSPRISCHCRPEDARAGEIVLRALQRSLGPVQVCPALRSPDAQPADAAAFVRPEAAALPGLRAVLERGGKVLAFGPPEPEVLPLLGLRAQPDPPPLAGLDAAELNFTEHHHESPGLVRYTEHPLALASLLRARALRRYDYAEWNNLGYGAIATDGSAFAAAGGLLAGDAAELARLERSGPSPQRLGAYLALHELPRGSLLWCARPVGPVDSVEWRLVERFLCDWRPELFCLPCLQQTPAGCRCLATMRLDCDEDVASARPLFEWYRSQGLPLSLAVLTGRDMRPEDLALMQDVRAAGGTLLSHSHTHPQNWGRDGTQALEEAAASRRWFAERWPGHAPPDLAVSPFHSNPPYAVQALEQAGFAGFVGGIIHNDPEYCLGRAGVVPFARGLVGISQQSMLHGDSRRNQGGVDTHLEAFALQYAARGIFGYLDHPFSARYAYGWDSEAQRQEAHARLVEGLRARPGVQFWSQERCFAFVRALAATPLRLERGRPVGQGPRPDVAARLRGEIWTLGASAPHEPQQEDQA